MWWTSFLEWPNRYAVSADSTSVQLPAAADAPPEEVISLLYSIFDLCAILLFITKPCLFIFLIFQEMNLSLLF